MAISNFCKVVLLVIVPLYVDTIFQYTHSPAMTCNIPQGLNNMVFTISANLSAVKGFSNVLWFLYIDESSVILGVFTIKKPKSILKETRRKTHPSLFPLFVLFLLLKSKHL